MRADVSGPGARRALGSAVAGASALVSGDDYGLACVLEEAFSASPTADVVDAALLATAEIFVGIAARRYVSPGRLVQFLGLAFEELTVGSGTDVDLQASALLVVASYLDDDFAAFVLGCEELVEFHDGPVIVRACLDVLAGAIRWRASDRGLDPVDVARSLCLNVARLGDE